MFERADVPCLTINNQNNGRHSHFHVTQPVLKLIEQPAFCIARGAHQHGQWACLIVLGCEHSDAGPSFIWVNAYNLLCHAFKAASPQSSCWNINFALRGLSHWVEKCTLTDGLAASMMCELSLVALRDWVNMIYSTVLKWFISLKVLGGSMLSQDAALRSAE